MTGTRALQNAEAGEEMCSLLVCICYLDDALPCLPLYHAFIQNLKTPDSRTPNRSEITGCVLIIHLRSDEMKVPEIKTGCQIVTMSG